MDDFTQACTNVPLLLNVVTNDYDLYGALDLSSGSILVNAVNGFAVYNGDGTITYTSNPLFTGNDSISYQICDFGIPSPIYCDTAKVYFSVINGNTPPIVIMDIDSTNINQDLYINVLDNDSDMENNTLTVSINTTPLNGSVFLQPNGLIQYTPNPGFSGMDSFTYDLCDDGCPSACTNGIQRNEDK